MGLSEGAGSLRFEKVKDGKNEKRSGATSIGVEQLLTISLKAKVDHKLPDGQFCLLRSALLLYNSKPESSQGFHHSRGVHWRFSGALSSLLTELTRIDGILQKRTLVLGFNMKNLLKSKIVDKLLMLVIDEIDDIFDAIVDRILELEDDYVETIKEKLQSRVEVSDE